LFSFYFFQNGKNKCVSSSPRNNVLFSVLFFQYFFPMVFSCWKILFFSYLSVVILYKKERKHIITSHHTSFSIPPKHRSIHFWFLYYQIVYSYIMIWSGLFLKNSFWHYKMFHAFAILRCQHHVVYNQKKSCYWFIRRQNLNKKIHTVLWHTTTTKICNVCFFEKKKKNDE